MLDNYRDGRMVPAGTSATIPVFNPSTGAAYEEVPESGSEDVAAACEAAAGAFAGWSRTTPAERSRRLHAAAALLEAHGDELVGLEVADTGKPRHLMTAEEMPAVVDVVSYFAGSCRMLEGAAASEYLEGVTSLVRREPIGVCAQITPWNYPLMMAVWKWAPAVAAGNTVVLKPSELTPTSTLRMAELCGEVLPPGVLNVVLGGASTGGQLVRQAGIAMVSLTGSPRAGRAVAGAAAERLLRSHLELGGNAPVIVFGDADLESAAEAVVGAGFYNAGQDCTAARRVIVERRVHDEFLELLAEQAATVVTGDPEDETTTFGPLISEAHLARVAGYLDRLEPGARILTGGRRIDRPGYFFEPTIVTDVSQEAEIVQSEVFGPVVTVQPFGGEEVALAMANGVEQGLTASVWTSDIARAGRFCRDLDFGAVSVNTHAPMASEMPHGGFGVSGYGKDLSVYGLLDYTRVKHVAHAW